MISPDLCKTKASASVILFCDVLLPSVVPSMLPLHSASHPTSLPPLYPHFTSSLLPSCPPFFVSFVYYFLFHLGAPAADSPLCLLSFYPSFWAFFLSTFLITWTVCGNRLSDFLPENHKYLKGLK